MRSVFIALLLCETLFGGITLDQINDKPSSRAKNFLIWQFLKQDVNASEASEAFYQIDTVNERFLFDYAAKTDEVEIRYTAECMQKTSTELMNIEQDDCLYLALSPIKAQHLQSYERELLAMRLGDRFGDVQWLRTMNHNNHFTLYSDLEPSLRLFLISGNHYRQDHFNHFVDDETLSRLTTMRGFNQLVYLTTTDPKMTMLQESLSNVSGGYYDPQTHFYLGINAKGDDPFEWNRLYKELVNTPPEKLYELIEQYDGEDSLAVQAYMIERAYLPYIHNYTMPYDQYMQGISIEQKAMLYALMRQETRLIPGLISRSFALGLMQMMPFNVDSISKIHPLKITSYDDMFNPKFNIAYSIEHMKHIDNTLFNPVLKAYAYNGGIGFTRRLLLSGAYFNPGDYEPFMSMELVGNAESREYGKRVLANYVIYKKILGENVSIGAIFDNLIQPDQSDYFRASELKRSMLKAQNP
ncbi:MAG: transglycosylase SLT domain-containing protein [Epsilonproteobacteria bacterium]|nr:transglycosylase SLT domain-containing protein [Campylobacterota bacterium]